MTWQDDSYEEGTDMTRGEWAAYLYAQEMARVQELDDREKLMRCELDGQYYSKGTAFKHQACQMIIAEKEAGGPF